MNIIEELIERNKKEGLLCACNKVMVPYNEPRILVVDNIIHGYDNCLQLRIK